MKKTWLAAVFFIAGLSSSAYATQYEFTTIEVPGALWTSANGINNLGHIVGTYSDGTGSHGFLYDGTGYLTIDYPGSGGNTGIKDINDSGKMVGEYNNGHKYQNFILDGRDFSTYSFPGNTETSINGLNDAGVAAGGYYDWPTNSSNGVLYEKSAKVVFPNTTIFMDVNDSGQMVGYDPDFWISYLYDGKDLSQIIFGDSPYGVDIWARSINDSGYVVGSYMEGGFLFDSANGRVSTINYPGAAYSGLSGINDLGYLVGSYTFNERGYGFLAIPIKKTAVPEPSPFVLLGLAMAAVCSYGFLVRQGMGADLIGLLPGGD
ncbi:MAG: hypothetical protein HS130_04155 [Deltaproteobacteria bacterium]|nr:hypothetical protein [Deltaproteobacteria bacterium]